ncbi:MAG: tagaturonate epimerase family protein [Anaerolineaceae bacterium]|nr:tagaturonate epimerase family protein [Anaerolineaceae bacterium]
MYITSKNENDQGSQLLHQSVVTLDRIIYSLAKTPNGIRLMVQADQDDFRLTLFDGERTHHGNETLVSACLTSENAAALRTQLPWLKPVALGLKTSAGMGDRLGLATPGHVRAIRKMNGKIAPIFTQQSIRENTRTGRTPQQVIDDAMWGIFQENWRDGYGADADHLKTTDDIDVCLKAGYSFFTVDPGEFVDNRAENADLINLRNYAKDLPSELNMEHSGLLNQIITAEHLSLTFDEKTLLKSMVKYGRAVWHVFKMYQYLLKNAGARPVEFEVSVDETDNPTSHAEHVYIASELRRLGVKWVSLAPRFVGRFEKGVDYIGDLKDFEHDIKGHAAIARVFGPYKISLHSGSDKFSIYKIAAQATRGLVHLKTAGTSYLEALRTIAALDPDFFKEIYEFCRNRFETDKVSYHISAQLSHAPIPSAVDHLAELLDNFDAREILHVTFGSVLKEKAPDGSFQFFDRLIRLLKENSELYAENIERHFLRHLTPFVMNE